MNPYALINKYHHGFSSNGDLYRTVNPEFDYGHKCFSYKQIPYPSLSLKEDSALVQLICMVQSLTR